MTPHAIEAKLTNEVLLSAMRAHTYKSMRAVLVAALAETEHSEECEIHRMLAGGHYPEEPSCICAPPAPAVGTEPEMDTSTLAGDIAAAINRHSAERGSNTPDFLLAEFLTSVLAAWDVAVTARETWYGRTSVLVQSLPAPPTETP